MVGDATLGPVMSSVLQFVTPHELKDDLNAQFRERWPALPPSLTLSKIRAVKREALLGADAAGIEVGTVALACVYFERLCLVRLVSKPNRRLAFAACLTLACVRSRPRRARAESARKERARDRARAPLSQLGHDARPPRPPPQVQVR